MSLAGKGNDRLGKGYGGETVGYGRVTAGKMVGVAYVNGRVTDG